MRERDRQRKKDNNKSQENCDWFQLNIVEHYGTISSWMVSWMVSWIIYKIDRILK